MLVARGAEKCIEMQSIVKWINLNAEIYMEMGKDRAIDDRLIVGLDTSTQMGNFQWKSQPKDKQKNIDDMQPESIINYHFFFNQGPRAKFTTLNTVGWMARGPHPAFPMIISCKRESYAQLNRLWKKKSKKNIEKFAKKKKSLKNGAKFD